MTSTESSNITQYVMVRHSACRNSETELRKTLISERTVVSMSQPITIKLTSAESETKVSILSNFVHFQEANKESLWCVRLPYGTGLGPHR